MYQLIRIALRNVVRNRRRSLITFFAVFLSLTIIVGLRGFLNGLHETVRQAVILGQTGALQVHRKGFLRSVSAGLDLDVPADDAFLARITAVPGIKAAAARINFGGMVNFGDTTAFAVMSAIDPVREPLVCPRRADLVSAGTALPRSKADAGVLTPQLAKSVGVTLGQRATLLTNDRDGVMNALEFDYVGAYGQPGLPLPDKKFGFVPLRFAEELLRMEGRATEIAVAVDRLEDVERLKPLLQSAVGPEYEVSTWHDVASFVDDVIATQNFVLGLLAGIFLFVALLGIANTMLMSVYERTREIGTMMAVGVKRREILALFLVEAATIGLAGGVLGAGAGLAFVLRYATRGIVIQIGTMTTPFYIYPTLGAGYIASVVALAAGGAALSALWPSFRASRLRPVEALTSV
jgi:putative ABC transport system permease protein